jgi:hypothetical protein
MEAKKLAKDLMTKEMVTGVIIPIVLVILAFIIVNKIMKGIGGAFSGAAESVGLKDTKEEANIKKTAAAAQNRANKNVLGNCWTSKFYHDLIDKTSEKKKTFVRLLSEKSVGEISYQIWDGIGTFVDNPEQILAAFKKMTNKAQISQLTERFEKEHSVDLLAWLENKLDTVHQKEVLTQILNYVEALPPGMDKR